MTAFSDPVPLLQKAVDAATSPRLGRPPGWLALYLAGAFASSGDIATARRIATAIPSQDFPQEDLRSYAMCDVAVATAKTGAAAAAKMLLALVNHPMARPDGTRRVAIVLAKRGDFDAAWGLVVRMLPGEWKVKACCALAELHADAGQLQESRNALSEADRAAAAINNHFQTLDAYQALTVAHARLGDFQSAYEVMHTYLAQTRWAAASCDLVEAVADLGDKQSAHAIAQAITDDHWRNWAFVALAVAEAKSGSISGASACINRIIDSSVQARAWCDAAKVLNDAGDRATARRALEQALRVVPAASGGNDYCRNEARAAIAEGLAGIGELAAARKILADLEPDEFSLMPDDYADNAEYENDGLGEFIDPEDNRYHLIRTIAREAVRNQETAEAFDTWVGALRRGPDACFAYLGAAEGLLPPERLDG